MEIKRADINQIEKTYLTMFGLASLEETSIDNGNKLFVKLIDDFRSGDLSVDQLSSFGFELFHKVGKRNEGSDLFNASLSASELTFALRSSATFSNIQGYLEDIEDFYNKYK